MANAEERSVVVGEVSSEVTTSTRRSTGTGLKKWMPITCSGRVVAMPSFMIGMEEVLDARITSSRATTLSSAAKTSVFSASSSTTASTTRSRSARSARSVVQSTRRSESSRSCSVIFDDRTPRSRLAVTRR